MFVYDPGDGDGMGCKRARSRARFLRDNVVSRHITSNNRCVVRR